MAMLNKYIEFLKHFNFKKKGPQHEISCKQPLDMNDLYILDCPEPRTKELKFQTSPPCTRIVLSPYLLYSQQPNYLHLSNLNF